LFSGCQDEKAKIQDILILENGEIGNIRIIEADEEAHIIDAKGRWVVPGFVDSHTHYDAELIASPGLKESARHGVTSIILGVVQ